VRCFSAHRSPRQTLHVATLVLLTLAPTCLAAVSNDTLRKELTRAGLEVTALEPSALDRPVADVVMLDDSRQFAIAFHFATDGSLLPAEFRLLRFDRSTRTWIDTTARSKGSSSVNPVCVGSLLNLDDFAGGLTVETHINPSAACTLLFSSDLVLKKTLNGWPLAWLRGSLLIYHRNQVHFAPTHSVEIASYDTASDQDRTLFPPQRPTPIRRSLSQRLARFYAHHPEWCNIHNDPCDAGRPESALIGEVVTNADTDAVAFTISYAPPSPASSPRRPAGPDAVVYVYRNVSDPAHTQVRELPRFAFEVQPASAGPDALAPLLRKKMLDRLFESPATSPPSTTE